MQALSLQKNAGLPSLQAPARCPRELLGVYLQLLPFAELFDLPCLAGKRFYKRLFCPGVTLWYFIFQRLQPDHSLDNVLCDAHNGGADALRPELSKKLLSTATTSFSNARKRLPLAFLFDVLNLQAQRIPSCATPPRERPDRRNPRRVRVRWLRPRRRCDRRGTRRRVYARRQGAWRCCKQCGIAARWECGRTREPDR